jgi:predicted ArsR family transcriptional regulator
LSGMRFTRQHTQQRLDHIEALLRERPMSARELAAVVHLSHKTVQQYLAHLAPQIRIARWERASAGRPTRFFSWGADKDARPPEPFTTTAKNRRYRRRTEIERPEVLEARAAAARIRRAEAIQPRRDPAVVALFGEAR